MNDVMNFLMQIVEFIRTQRLQRRLFNEELESSESLESLEHSCFTSICRREVLELWKFLERFQEKLPEIISLLNAKGVDPEIVKNEKWFSDLAFLTCVTYHSNNINLK